MAELTLYHASGDPFEGETAAGEREQISELDKSETRLAVDTSGTATAVCYVRARESEYGRSNRYYVRYRGTGTNFGQLKSRIERYVEEDCGLHLHTSHEEMETFRRLDSVSPTFAGSDFERDAVDHLLAANEHLQFGVPDTRAALGHLAYFLEERTSVSVAVSHRPERDVVDRFDLVFVPDPTHAELTPLGDTSEKMDRARSEMQGRFVSQTVSSIADDVATLRSQTDLSDAELRRRLDDELPLDLGGGGGVSGRLSGDGRFGGDSRFGGGGSDRTQRLIWAVLIVAVVGLVAVGGYFVYTSGAADGLLSLGGGGGLSGNATTTAAGTATQTSAPTATATGTATATRTATQTATSTATATATSTPTSG